VPRKPSRIQYPEISDPTARNDGNVIELPIGVLDLFKIGIGPSSSHTMGPMKAASAFIDRLTPEAVEQVCRISVTVFGSLAWTGKGHSTDKALVLGLAGYLPDRIEPD
jgi:L-serine dehydratase